MHYVSRATANEQANSQLAHDVPQQRRQDKEVPGQPKRAVPQVCAALVRAGRPVRARALAHSLDLPPAEVTAELRRLQDAGIAVSHERRWTAATAAQQSAKN